MKTSLQQFIVQDLTCQDHKITIHIINHKVKEVKTTESWSCTDNITQLEYGFSNKLLFVVGTFSNNLKLNNTAIAGAC